MPASEDRHDQASDEQPGPQDITEFFSHELHDWWRGISIGYHAEDEISARGATPATMDIPVSSAYLSGMFARLVTMLAVLAIAVMTTVTSAHAARMSAEPDHAVHVGEMMQVSPTANSFL